MPILPNRTIRKESADGLRHKVRAREQTHRPKSRPTLYQALNLDCDYCNNCGGIWIQVRILRKRQFVFEPCTHCQAQSGLRARLRLIEKETVDYESEWGDT